MLNDTAKINALNANNYIRIKKDTFYGLPLPSAGNRQKAILFFGSTGNRRNLYTPAALKRSYIEGMLQSGN
jgi:hypothetical protein